MKETKTQGVQTPVVKSADELAAAGMFSEIRAQIAKHRADYMELTIKGTDDVEGFKRLDEARKILVKTRTGTDKIGKEMSADLVRRKKINDAATKEILDELAPIEAHVKGQVEAYKAAVDAEMAEQKRKADERNEIRFNRLRGLGFRFDTGMASWTVTLMGKDVVVGMKELTAMDDVTFDNTYDEVSVLYQQNQQRLLDEQKAREAQEQEAAEKLAALQKIADDQAEELRRLREKPNPLASHLESLHVAENPLTPEECFPAPASIDDVIMQVKKSPFVRMSSSSLSGPAATNDNPFESLVTGESRPDQALDGIKLMRFAQSLKETIRYPDMVSLEGVLALEIITQQVNQLIDTVISQANDL